MGRSTDYLSVAQFDLLGWVSRGCPAGAYEGTSYRVSVRALNNRGLVKVEGSGPHASGRAGSGRHAERTNPLNGPLRVLAATSCSHQELEPHMNGWSTYGPHQR